MSIETTKSASPVGVPTVVEQLASAIEAMAENPKGGKMAAIAYMLCAKLIRSKLSPSFDLLVDENERLRQALEPFDEALGEDDADIGSETEATLTYGPVKYHLLTLRDFRRARDALDGRRD